METPAHYPKFYINCQENKAVRLSDAVTIQYYQLIKYPNGDVKHSSGKTTITDPHRMKAEFVGYSETTEAVFKDMARDYYSKEKENAARAREYLFGTNDCEKCGTPFVPSYANHYECPVCPINNLKDNL